MSYRLPGNSGLSPQIAREGGWVKFQRSFDGFDSLGTVRDVFDRRQKEE